MARKVRGFERVLDAPALFAIAYGEIGASIYFALGIVAAAALGLTPVVLARSPGVLFVARRALVRGGHRGDPGDRRRGDVHAPRVQRPRRLRHGLGAVPRLPDRDRALGALPAALPRRRARGRRAARLAVGRRRRASSRSRAIGGRPAARRSRLHTPALVRRAARPRRAGADRHPRARARLLARDAHRRASTSRPARAGSTTCSSRCRSGCSPTRGSRRSRTSPRRRASRDARCRARSSPRSGSSSLLTVLVAVVGVTAFPAEDGSTELGDRLARGADRRHRDRVRRASCRRWSSTSLRVVVGLSGALILVMAVDDLDLGLHAARALDGEHGMLPREFGRLERRTLVSREAIAAITRRRDRDRDRRGRARTTRRRSSRAPTRSASCSRSRLAQLAVIRLRRARARPAAAVPRPARRPAPRSARAAAGADRGAAHRRRSACSRWSPTPARRYAGPAWLARRARASSLVHARAPSGAGCSTTSTRGSRSRSARRSAASSCR